LSPIKDPEPDPETVPFVICGNINPGRAEGCRTGGAVGCRPLTHPPNIGTTVEKSIFLLTDKHCFKTTRLSLKFVLL
jgi:hypothetical protein